MTEEKFGRYEIRGELGRGGMATVWLAYDPRFERDVAIKVLPHAMLHDPQFRTRFEREAKTIGTLEHPAIVPVYDFGEEDGQPYIVMRYMSGGSLKDRIDQGPINITEAAQMVARLAPALDAAHKRGVIHRDLKPGNILFDQYGNAFLSDFGIARLTHDPSVATLTQGAILGTPAYMSPEQIHGDKEIDGRADIYALGVIFYEMLTGCQPYKADTPGKVMMMHIMDTIPAARRVKTDLPEAVDGVIAKSMAKDPDKRFSTTEEMRRAVNSAVHALDATQLGADSTTVARPPADATMVSAHGEVPSRPRPATAPSLTPLPSAGASAPAAAGAPARKLPKRGIILGGIALLVLLGLIAGGGAGIFYMITNRGDATPTAQVAAVEPTLPVTEAPVVLPASPTFEPTDLPTDTPQPVPSATATSEPTPTDEPTATSEPLLVSLGGADKIAFINAADLWIANIDGSDPIQLTSDGIAKFNPNWTPNGSSVTYIAGKCVKMADITTQAVTNIVCFDNAQNVEAFEFSPDGTKIAVTVDRELYIIPNDFSLLANIRSGRGMSAISTCPEIEPWTNKAYKFARWSPDGSHLALIFKAPVNNLLFDMIRVMDFSGCYTNPTPLDEFPASRFTMTAYNDAPYIQNFSWNGTLFLLNSHRRNDGFGDLYLYNGDLKKLQSPVEGVTYLNPINGSCCYRDATWSPDGRYLMFAFQDIGAGANSTTEVYYVAYSDILPGAQFEPLAFPEGLFAGMKEKPQFALRKAP